MRLISLNLWGGRAFKELDAFLRREKDSTDIFCFQEVLEYSLGEADKASLEAKTAYHPAGLTEKPDLYSELEGILDQHNSFLSEPYSSGMERLATFVRKGIESSVETLPVYAKLPMVIHGRPYQMGSRMQHSSIKIKDVAYDIGNVHGLWKKNSKDDTPERIEQSAEILRLMSSYKGRKVLAGDLNLLPSTKSIGMIEEHMRNLIKDYGITNTRSSLYTRDFRYADYAFVSEDVKVLDFKTMNENASDHLPLVLDFE
ncbi:Endonuclease/exonuclease/phosphatase [mine drainage metagenome]|uniref:Endonuclease/exonuclease/phosphatase n=1 Tax=mine drainage metagenome TaxID=410659 RepID=T1B9W2_9ZZZZ